MSSLRQKYGQENSGFTGNPLWIYDGNGKLLTQVPNVAPDCQPKGNDASAIVPNDLTHDSGTLNLSDTVPDNANLGLSSAECVGYFYAEAWNIGTTPNEKVGGMLVSIRSGALTYNSMKSTHNWLQSEADAINKQQDGAAATRPGPKL
jgi:hypothetical protein